VKGHGLGLSYVQNVVRSLGGKIKVKSILNEGSTFFIVFPTIKEGKN
jgi:two-component system phosphate regulon sensor histidine kinase PhoR